MKTLRFIPLNPYFGGLNCLGMEKGADILFCNNVAFIDFAEQYLKSITSDEL